MSLKLFWWYKIVNVDEFSVKVTKVTFRISVTNTHILSLLFYLIDFQHNEKVILLKVCKLDNFELHNTLQVRKDSVIHMQYLAVYMKQGLSFAQDLSVKTFQASYLYFGLALLDSVAYFLFLYIYIYVVDANPPAYLLVFNFRHKDCLTYSSGTDRFGELCYNFSISNKLTQIINFPAQIPYGDSHSLSLLDLFLFSGTRAD